VGLRARVLPGLLGPRLRVRVPLSGQKRSEGRGGRVNVYVWASTDGKSVHLVFAESKERARELAGRTGTRPP
jgi:hypothetical protein